MLPDYLRPGLAVVFVGTPVSTVSACRGRYYSNPRNGFWRLLHATGLVGDRLLGPEDDASLCEFGIGLTDLVKARAESSDARLARADFDVTGFVEKIERYRPVAVAFNGGNAAKVVARWLKMPVPSIGPATWRLSGAAVYRLPSSSGAAAMPADAKRRAWRAFGEWLQSVATKLSCDEL